MIDEGLLSFKLNWLPCDIGFLVINRVILVGFLTGDRFCSA
jgi:hypothetical protein